MTGPATTVFSGEITVPSVLPDYDDRVKIYEV